MTKSGVRRKPAAAWRSMHRAVQLAFAAASLTVFAAEPKPNILLIVSDDHGYADTGFQGCKDIPTPHLDRLAREGLRLSLIHI